MTVKRDEDRIEPPPEAASRVGRWIEGRQLGAELRALPVGESLTCDRSSRRVKRLIYAMRSPEGMSMVHEYLVLDMEGLPGWSRVWRLRPTPAESDSLPLFTDPDDQPL